MKKIIVSLAILGLLSPNFALADVIDPNSHPVKRCVTIDNIKNYSEISLIGYITGPTAGSVPNPLYMIESSKCLEKGYKFNKLDVYAVEKNYLASKGMSNIDMNSENVLLSNEKIEPYGGYVDNSNPLISEDITYSIAGFADNKVIIYKSKQVSTYNNGTPNKTETFEKPNLPTLRQTLFDGFTDVSSTHPNFEAIEYVRKKAIVEGYPDGTFRPDQKINRAEFTKIIILSKFDQILIEDCLKSLAETTGSLTFPDIPKSSWFTGAVCLASQKDIIEGYPDGSFKPEQNISFVEGAKIIVKSFGYNFSQDATPWYKPFVVVLAEKKAIPTSIASFGTFMTRGEMAEVIYRLKTNTTSKPSASFESLEANFESVLDY